MRVPLEPHLPLTFDQPLETDRLLIRAVEATDLVALLTVNGDDEVTQYLPYASWQHMDDARAWLARMTAMQASGMALQLVIVDKVLATAIGTVLLFRYEQVSERVELGYVLGRAYWGQGFMREALHAVVAHAFGPLPVRRLEAEVDPRNTRSGHVLETLGFVKEGLLRQRWLTKGEPCDINVFGLLRHEWRGTV